MSRVDRDVAASVAEGLRGQAQQLGWARDPVGWARDVLGVHLWSKQREISDSLVQNKKTVVASCHGTGKALAVDTPIPTPDGFAEMGDINAGDIVLNASGDPVKVVATTGVHLADMWKITFSRGETFQQITASSQHLWPVMNRRALASAEVASQRRGLPLHLGHWRHRAKITDTLSLARRVRAGADLFIPPSVPAAENTLWRPDAALASLIGERGAVDIFGRPCLTWHTRSGKTPEELLWMRRELRVRGMHTLLRRTRRGGSTELSLVLPVRAGGWLVDPDERALAATAADPVEKAGWRIESVEPVGEGEVQCIQVDDPEHLYLCGEAGIPTHNSMIASVLACWWISTRPVGDAIVVSTAPSYAQVNKILWEEIRKHHATAKRRGKPMIGYVTQSDEWKTVEGTILGFGRKPPTGDQGAHAFQGIHRRYVLVVIDEACGIPPELWTGSEAITTNAGCRILAIGNPDDRNTDFGENYLSPKQAQDWNRIAVPASSTPNFTGEEVPALLNEVLVSKEWCEQRERAWGKDDPRYLSKIEAKFPEQSQSSLFAPALITSAFEEVPPQPVGQVLRLGVDVARFGTDDNVLVSHMGTTARVEASWNGTDTVSSGHQVLHLAEEIKKRQKAAWVEIRVDAVGLGAGVIDTLNARAALLERPWFSVYEMHGNASPPSDVGGSVQGYGNARAFWYDHLRQSMRNKRVQIEEHERLADDLRIIFYHFKSGRLFIMSKDEMRSKFKRSPDIADALVYATAPVAEGLESGQTISQSAQEVAAGLAEMEDDAMLTISPF